MPQERDRILQSKVWKWLDGYTTWRFRSIKFNLFLCYKSFSKPYETNMTAKSRFIKTHQASMLIKKTCRHKIWRRVSGGYEWPVAKISLKGFGVQMEPFTTSASEPLASHLRASSALSCAAKAGAELHCRLNGMLYPPQLKMSVYCRIFAVLHDCSLSDCAIWPQWALVRCPQQTVWHLLCLLYDVHLSWDFGYDWQPWLGVLQSPSHSDIFIDMQNWNGLLKQKQAVF